MLGHDVVYVEDTRLWPIYQRGEIGNCARNVAHLSAVMDAFGFGQRWAYRDEVSNDCYGLSVDKLREFCRSADLFVNVSCSTFLRDEYREIPVRALVDTDPMFTQIQYMNGASLTNGEPGMRDMIEGHSHHFTFGENIGNADCRIPQCGIAWLPVRQPVCLSEWQVSTDRGASRPVFTTVMNWAATKALTFGGETWGQKDVEMMRFLDLPGLASGVRLALAVNQTTGTPFPTTLFREHGWDVLDPYECASDWRSYRAFLSSSNGEFSVAKETYTKSRTGWFSCRSACYLASGRPVVAQETGWSSYIPTGSGLFAFGDVTAAAEALATIQSDKVRHSRAAREIAEEFFSSQKVLGSLLRQVSF
jgi:hypothetical protein